MKKHLITRTNIAEFRPLSSSIPEERLTPYIIECQQVELRGLLGEALFVDFLGKFDVSGDPQYNNYQDLLNGKTYTFGSITYEHPGLIPFLVYHTLARFMRNNPINVTSYGITRKTSEGSEPIDNKTLDASIDELRGIASTYEQQIKDYLSRNQSSYPLYSYSRGDDRGMSPVKFVDLGGGNNYSTNPGNGRTNYSY